MALTDVAALSADLQTYFNKKLLMQTEQQAVLDQFGEKVSIPSHSSKTVTFTSYPDITDPSSPLTDGVTPSDTAVTNTAITATTDQWGAYITVTDLAELTVKHPVTNKFVELLSRSAARVYDAGIESVLAAGTNVTFANGRANQGLLVSGDKLTTTELIAVRRNLKNRGAPTYDGTNYVLVTDPFGEAQLLEDATFREVSYRRGDGLLKGEVGVWMGFRIVVSNLIPQPATDISVAYAIGKEAYAVVDLQNIRMYVNQPGGDSDPLHQRRKLGYKFATKAVILNQNFLERIEFHTG